MARPSGRRTSQFQLTQGQPRPSKPIVQNNFTAGLKTEFTGLNFPPNAAIDTQNCVFNRIGNITRRQGINYEPGASQAAIGSPLAMCSFIWTNAGGDGTTQLYVQQIGNILYFYQMSNTTINLPLSGTKLSTTVNINTFSAGGASPNITECQFTSGNGYLFVFHPSLEPFYCTFVSGVVAANQITVQIRDLLGIPEPGIPDNYRPLSLSLEHTYNLYNQGWTNSPQWSTVSTTSNTLGTGTQTFTVGAGLSISNGDNVLISAIGTGGIIFGQEGATVTSYSGTTLVINSTSFYGAGTFTNWTLVKTSAAHIATWLAAEANYPSNSDIWWTFKDTSEVFNPAVTAANVTLGGPAPKGSIILNAFNQQRGVTIPTLTAVSTTVRPKAGAWFQGRVFYAGVDASFLPTGDEPFFSWSENIYFSQIAISTNQFGKCYQTNDPTDQDLSDLLPSDGGIIVIQGAGSIYNLWPVQNGLLVFAANGIWFITGNSGVGFTATDYTVTKISGIQNISGTSIVDVLGHPMFWNKEGIYAVVTSTQQAEASMGFAHAGFTVQNLTLPTIQAFYNNIPTDSKRFARGSYNPVNGIIQWCYRSTEEGNITNRYSYDSILNFNTFTQAFYPWTLGSPINDIKYATYPQLGAPNPTFKYAVTASTNFSFAEENDNVNWKDFISTNYVSYYVTGYTIDGSAMLKVQPEYIYMYLNNLVSTSYRIQGRFNFSITGNSGKWSAIQQVNTNIGEFNGMYRRHRIRGSGVVYQIKVSSTDGRPFDIMGWAILETQNPGI